VNLYAQVTFQVHHYGTEADVTSTTAQLLAPVDRALRRAEIDLLRRVDQYHALPVAPLALRLNAGRRSAYLDGAQGESLKQLCRHLGLQGVWAELAELDPALLPLMLRRNSSAAFLQLFVSALIPGAQVEVSDAERERTRSDAPVSTATDGYVHVHIDLSGPHQWRVSEAQLRSVLARLATRPGQVSYTIRRLPTPRRHP
jgi:hypothetical protein